MTEIFVDTFPIHSVYDLKTTNQIYKHTSSNDTLPIWSFSFTVAVDHATVLWEGGFDSVSQKIQAQFDSVNVRFNDASVFEGIIDFYIDTIYEFNDSLPPVNSSTSDYMLQYYLVTDVDYHLGMFWGMNTNVVQLYWSIFDEGGPFGTMMNTIMSHEFGHTRGAIDIYFEHVSSANNPVNGEAFPYDSTIMGNTYYSRMWDDHSYNVINRNKDEVYRDYYYLTECFPETIGVTVKSSNNMNISDARIRVYIVPFRSFMLYENPIIDRYTDENGKLVFEINPYQPLAFNYPPFIKNCNLMITADKGSSSEFIWMTMADVQVSFFNDSTVPYFQNIVMEDIVLDINDELPLPQDYKLWQNYPNPFNPTTTILFSIAKNQIVTLEILNIKGQIVKTLLNNNVRFGRHEIEWDGTNSNNHKVSTGIYYYRITTDDFVQTNKMLLLK